MFEPYIKAGVISDGDYKLLFMSSTNSARTVGDISLMLGLSMPKCHMIWSDSREFLKSNVCLRLYTFVQRNRHLTTSLENYILKHNDGRRFIIYSNFAHRCDGIRKNIFEILHAKGRSDYVLLITGEIFRAKRICYTSFCG